MEKKQRSLPGYSGRLILLSLIFNAGMLFCQEEAVLNEKLKVQSYLDTKDSTLNISYQSVSGFSMLIWGGDLMIAALLNENDISGKYLASPIVNEIYLVNKRLKTTKVSDGYFLRNDSSELNLFNYRKLDNGESLILKIFLQNDSLFKAIRKGEILIKGAITILPNRSVYNRIDTFLLNKSDPVTMKWLETTQDATELIPAYSSYLKAIEFNNVKWHFNRPSLGKLIEGRPWGVHYADFSKLGLLKPKNVIDKKAFISSFERLYLIANKYYFQTKIKIR